MADVQEAGGISVSGPGSPARAKRHDTENNAGQDDESTRLQDVASDDGSESESESEDDSDEEAAVANRRLWSKRHWIAAGGKENRISLWEIY